MGVAEKINLYEAKSQLSSLVDRAASGEEGVRRLRDEVRILASLEHPGIARFLDGGRARQRTPPRIGTAGRRPGGPRTPSGGPPGPPGGVLGGGR